MAWQVGTYNGSWEVGTTSDPAPSFGIISAGEYRHGESCVLDVVGVTGAFTIRWSPSVSDPSATGSVELTVTDSTLDGAGNGPVTVTGNRGIVRYLTTGYLWVVMGAETAVLAATLLLEGGKQAIVLGTLIGEWQASTAVTIGDRKWNPDAGDIGRIYEAQATGTTGTTAPTHDDGIVSDGAINWLFLQDYYRLSAIADLATTDQVIWWNPIPNGTVAVLDDATFNSASGVRRFAVEAHIDGSGYTDVAIQIVYENRRIRPVTMIRSGAAVVAGSGTVS